jgi:hypothetical protein
MNKIILCAAVAALSIGSAVAAPAAKVSARDLTVRCVPSAAEVAAFNAAKTPLARAAVYIQVFNTCARADARLGRFYQGPHRIDPAVRPGPWTIGG